MAQEVEIKFAMADPRRLVRQARAAGLQLRTRRTFESNTLYDLPGQPLRARGELLRLRQYGKLWTLTHKSKGTAARHKRREELETAVTDGPAMDAVLRALGFAPSFRYEKYRTEFASADGKGHVVIDETPIGNFGEIEGPARWIDRTAKQLAITPANYITDSYAGLFFAWKARTGSPALEMTFTAVKPRSRRGALKTSS